MKKCLSDIKKFYNRFGWVVRFSIILIISLWINFFLFPAQIPTEDLNPTYDATNITYLEIPQNLQECNRIGPTDIDRFLWCVVQQRQGEVCFVNDGSHFVYLGIPYFVGVTALMNYSEQLFEVVDKECRYLPEGAENFTYRWSFDFIPPLKQIIHNAELSELEAGDVVGQLTFVPNVHSYVTLSWLAQMIRVFVIFYSLGLIFWGGSRIYIFIKYGIDKK